eukprot:862623-Pelagomonas_calceolata.AAC.1
MLDSTLNTSLSRLEVQIAKILEGGRVSGSQRNNNNLATYQVWFATPSACNIRQTNVSLPKHLVSTRDEAHVLFNCTDGQQNTKLFVFVSKHKCMSMAKSSGHAAGPFTASAFR